MAESESFENSESFADSGSFEGVSSPAIDESAAGDTVGQNVHASDDVSSEDKPKNAMLKDFTVFNAILLTSLLFILLSSFFLFWELSGYGGLDGSWRTGSVGR